MRYFLAIFALCVLATVGVLGFRGSHFRKPPLYIFPDMERQPKLRPQTANAFFDNGLSSRLPVAGTIARSQPIHVGDKLVYPWQDSPVTTGRVTGTTNFVELNPLPVTDELLQRGQQVFNINCAACHSKLGDGNGTPKRIGAMAVVGQPARQAHRGAGRRGALQHDQLRQGPDAGLRRQPPDPGPLGGHRLSARAPVEPARLAGRGARSTARRR